MQSTFYGLTIAGSGLSAYQNAINTTANNVSNVRTEGYSRQEVLMEAAAALRSNQKYGTVGAGVEVTAIQQIRNVYYDLKYWSASASLGEYEAKQEYLSQIETYFLDNEEMEGFSTIFANMYTNMETLNSQASQFSARQSFVSTTQSLTTYFQTISNDLSTLQSEINEVIYTDVDKINSIATKIAALNKEINIVEQRGGEASSLRDERALLVDDLAQLVPVETVEEQLADANGAKSFRVTVCGHVLVDAYETNSLRCLARDEKVNQSDAEGLYDIYWVERNGELTNVKLEPNSKLMSGEIKGLFAMRDGNNGANFTGSITSFDEATNLNGETVQAVRIDDPSITDVSNITMNARGIIRLGNREVAYDGFELNYDADEDKYYYIVYLKNNEDGEGALSGVEQTASLGAKAGIGSDIEYMGIPYYQGQLNAFLRSFSQAFNELEQSGFDYYGNAGVNYLTGKKINEDGQYAMADAISRTTLANATTGTIKLMTSKADSYYQLLASNVTVNADIIENPYLFACSNTNDASDVENSALIDELYKLCTEENIYRNTNPAGFLQCILSDISVDAQESEIFVSNFNNIQNSIIAQRKSVSGVDEDEEALNLVKFQNAYSLSSKVVQILSEVYDRLILETGV